MVTTGLHRVPPRKRKHLSLEVRLAALTLAWLRRDYRKNCEISHAEAKKLTARQIIGMIEYHHWPIAHADGGPDEAWNLDPIIAIDHLNETRKQAKERAHARKVRRAVDAHAQRMLLKRPGKRPPKKSRWPKRSFPNAVHRSR